VSAVTFVPLAEEHRAMLQGWLSSEHARQWWGDPAEEVRLIYAVEDGQHEPYVACIAGKPVAYIQAWWPTRHDDIPWQKDMPRTTRGIDITVGDAENLGKGLGSLIVKNFAAKLFAEGATRIIIDPDIRNERAIAAYVKAGFRPYDTHVGQDGTDLLMELLPGDFDHAAPDRQA
jgi:aminoglycoside 6'-N-acetyltransferase